MRPLLAALRLETAAAIGLIAILVGVGGSAAAIFNWGSVGFGELDPRGTIRIVLPSATLVALGALWIFTGLAGSLITLGRPTRRDARSDPRSARVEDASDELVEQR